MTALWAPFMHRDQCTHLLWVFCPVYEALEPQSLSDLGDDLGEVSGIGPEFSRFQFVIGNVRTSCYALFVFRVWGRERKTGA